jgi:hypothetical protein
MNGPLALALEFTDHPLIDFGLASRLRLSPSSQKLQKYKLFKNPIKRPFGPPRGRCSRARSQFQALPNHFSLGPKEI